MTKSGNDDYLKLLLRDQMTSPKCLYLHSMVFLVQSHTVCILENLVKVAMPLSGENQSIDYCHCSVIPAGYLCSSGLP